MDIILNPNEFYNGLVNFILFMRLYATNTSRRQQSLVDVFATETLSYGDRKAFIFSELPRVEDYSLTSSLLTIKPIKYSEEFIGNPIKKKIPLSMIEPFLKMASMNSSGMQTFTSYVLGLMETSKFNYLYNEIMKDLLSWNPSISSGKQMKQSVSLFDTNAITTATELNAAENVNQKRIALAWQKTIDDFSILSDVFIDIDNTTDNTNFQTAIKLEDLIFIGNAKYLNERIVNLMATMLKSDVIDRDFRMPYTIKVPQVTFDKNSQSNCIGFVVHKYWYQWFYHFNFMGNFLDIDNMHLKNVLHFWYSKGRLKNLPATRIDAVVQGS